MTTDQTIGPPRHIVSLAGCHAPACYTDTKQQCLLDWVHVIMRAPADHGESMSFVESQRHKIRSTHFQYELLSSATPAPINRLLQQLRADPPPPSIRPHGQIQHLVFLHQALRDQKTRDPRLAFRNPARHLPARGALVIRGSPLSCFGTRRLKRDNGFNVAQLQPAEVHRSYKGPFE
jgi:hypothetical protein